jgi:hypothetical protein
MLPPLFSPPFKESAMKKAFLALGLTAAMLTGCTSVESATVGSNEIAATGGEAVAVIQANSIGFTFLFHIVDIVTSDLDQVVNKLLVGEAKAMGATKVDLKYASTTPRHGIFALLTGGFFGFTSSSAMGVAVK